MKKRTLTPLQQFLIGFNLILVVIILSSFLVVYASMKPRLNAKSEATKIAESYAHLTRVTNFNLYYGSQTYYSVFGTNSDNQQVIVVINKKTKDINVYKVADGISRDQAKAVAFNNGAKVIGKVTFGMSDGTPIWEVASGANYYLINFQTGELIKKEGL